jgi:cell division septation protein DedD
MYPKFSTDFIKIVIFSALVALLFSLAGLQAGVVYHGLFVEEKKTLAPLYVFPVSEAKPLAARKVLVSKKKLAMAEKSNVLEKTPAVKKSIPLKKSQPRLESVKPRQDKIQIPTDPPVIRLTYPEKISRENPSQGSRDPILYSIQTGIFKNKGNVDKNISYLQGQGYDPVMVELDCNHQIKIYAVRFGKFTEKNAARAAFLKFKQKEKKDALVTPLYSSKVLIGICKSSLK